MVFCSKLLIIKKLKCNNCEMIKISLKDFTFKFKNVGLPLPTQNEWVNFF